MWLCLFVQCFSSQTLVEFLEIIGLVYLIIGIFSLMGSIYNVFIINRAGSLIFDWDNGREDGPTLTANEKIILSSMFYSLYTIAAQLSPASKSSGIEVLDTSQFR